MKKLILFLMVMCMCAGLFGEDKPLAGNPHRPYYTDITDSKAWFNGSAVEGNIENGKTLYYQIISVGDNWKMDTSGSVSCTSTIYVHDFGDTYDFIRCSADSYVQNCVSASASAGERWLTDVGFEVYGRYGFFKGSGTNSMTVYYSCYKRMTAAEK